MPLQTKTFGQFVTDQVTAMQGKQPNLQFPVGSIELALVQSNAGVALWFQGIMLQLLAITRFSSSTGEDLDSAYADFNFFRNSSQKSSGLVNFSRHTPTNQAVVKVGDKVSTSVGNIQFEVYADPNNPNFNVGLNGYVLAPSVSSISVPVVALVGGLSGNVNASTINTISSPIVGVDNVNNPAPFTNGYDSESDDHFRQRFIIYINSLYLGTLLAYETAIQDGHPAIFYNIAENKNINGDQQLGFNTVIIDDGSGSPPPSLLESITTKIKRVNGLAIMFSVYPVVVLQADLEVDIKIDPLYNQSQIEESIRDIVGDYISSLQIGQSLILTKIYQLIYESSPGVLEASNLTINNNPTDLSASFKQRIFLNSFSITEI